MTQDEIKNLKAGDSIGYQLPGKAVIEAIVIQNGPRMDIDGKAITYMGEILTIQLGSGPTQVSWEPENYPDGIPELVPPNA